MHEKEQGHRLLFIDRIIRNPCSISKTMTSSLYLLQISIYMLHKLNTIKQTENKLEWPYCTPCFQYYIVGKKSHRQTGWGEQKHNCKWGYLVNQETTSFWVKEMAQAATKKHQYTTEFLIWRLISLLEQEHSICCTEN